GYSPESDFAIWQQLPFDFSRVAFSQHIFAAQEIAFGSRHEAMPEAAHFGKTHIGPAVVDYRLAHTPEELNFALIGVIADNLGHAQRNPVTFLRPAQAIVVGVFELQVAEGLDAPGRTEIRNHVFHRVGVVLVDGIDKPAWPLERHHPRRFGAVGGFDVHQRRPCFALIGAAGGNDVLAAISFPATPGGQHTYPCTVIGNDNIGLVAVIF